MFDRVRVRPSPETEVAGVAGREGVVHGMTTVSATGVDVIGPIVDDTAIAVALQGAEDALWFSSELLELVDHNPGAEVTIAGSTAKLKREASGEWMEVRRKLPISEWPAWVRRFFRPVGSRTRSNRGA
jgi:hypothetical protein